MSWHLSPKYWVDLALGRTDRLLHAGKTPAEPVPSPSVDFDKPLYRWQRNYILALKIAELHLRGGRSRDRMADLLHWMYHDFIIGGPAVRLACQYFAPGSARKRIFKGIESPDREKALAGIRNAAWDLTLLSEWLRHVARQQDPSSENPLMILCSLDRHLRELARSLLNFSPPEQRTDAEFLVQLFESLWGRSDGRRLATILDSYQRTRDNPSRQLHQKASTGFISEMIATGESVIRSWTPRTGGGPNR